MADKAKCSNCGKNLEVEENKNFKLYCTAKACREIARNEILAMGKKRKK